MSITDVSYDDYPRVFDLTAASLANTLDDRGAQELERLVLEDEAARQLYVQIIDDSLNLRTWAADTDTDLFDTSQLTEPHQRSNGTSVSSRPKSLLNWASRHPKGPAVVIAATLLIAAIVVMGLVPVKEWMAKDAKNSHEQDVAKADNKDFVARLSNWQNDKWLEGTRPPLDDPRLNVGDRLKIGSGLIEVTYLTGARVVIEGPAEFVIGRMKDEGGRLKKEDSEPEGHPSSFIPHPSNAGYLALGKLVARIEGKKAQGFAIETPSARVEDFGTEFGVEVQESGSAEFVVLSGKVDIVRDHGDGPEQRVRLLQDEGAFVASGNARIARRKKVDARFVAAMRARLKTIGQVPDEVGPVVAIRNAGFELAGDLATRGNLATVAHWVEENPEKVFVDDNGDHWTPEADRTLYLSGAGAAVNQDLRRKWASSDTYALGIIGFEPQWSASSPGDAFRIQLRETDGTVLWDSGSQSVDGTVTGAPGNVSYAGTGHAFRWTIDASKFPSVPGATEGSRINLRIVADGGSPYLDDISLSVTGPDEARPAREEGGGSREDQEPDAAETQTFGATQSEEVLTAESENFTDNLQEEIE